MNFRATKQRLKRDLPRDLSLLLPMATNFPRGNERNNYNLLHKLILQMIPNVTCILYVYMAAISVNCFSGKGEWRTRETRAGDETPPPFQAHPCTIPSSLQHPKAPPPNLHPPLPSLLMCAPRGQEILPSQGIFIINNPIKALDLCQSMKSNELHIDISESYHRNMID